MRTINEHEFVQLCQEVRRETPAIWPVTADGAGRTSVLLHALLERVCAHLGLDPERQMTELDDRDGFALLQTLEEHMEPEFSYSILLDRYLLTDV